MIVVVDTNILMSAFDEEEFAHRNLTMYVAEATPKSMLGLDHERYILHEYERNIRKKSKLFWKWLKRLEEKKRIEHFDGRLSKKHRKRLSALGCHEKSDHVFIAVAFNSDKILISEDSDMGKGYKADTEPHPQALNYLTQTMQLKVYDAEEACTLWRVSEAVG